MEGKAAAKRLVEILETPTPLRTGSLSPGSPRGPLTIEFTGVTYTYPGNDRRLSRNQSNTASGTCTALVGRSGAGKSTLVNLLLRFMDAQDGTITVNGIPLIELPVETWREYLALVPQRPYLFYGSVRANIRLARPTASDREVEQAAELAGAAEFISRLPQAMIPRSVSRVRA